MFCCVNKFAEVIAKTRIVKLQHLLVTRISRNVEVFPVISESFAKFHSPSFKPMQKSKCNFSDRYNNICILSRKYSNQLTHGEIKESEINYDECFKDIANGNPDIEKKLKMLEFEINVKRAYAARLPKVIKREHWEEMLLMQSRFQKVKYLNYLFKSEVRNNSNREELKKQARNDLWAEREKEENLSYGIGNNTLFLRVYEQSINKLKNLKLFTASYYSQHIVFDCSYGSYMSKLNNKFCAKQILTLFRDNRDHLSPFHLKLCNVNPNDELIIYLSTFLGGNLDNFLDVSSQSYLDLYPKEKLVYLTPHCKEMLREYNEDDIYIVGAFVDRGSGGKISLGKAKENNLRMAKLPLDKHLIWEKGSKSLPLNIVHNILMDLRLYRNWNKALENVPRRFLMK